MAGGEPVGGEKSLLANRAVVKSPMTEICIEFRKFQQSVLKSFSLGFSLEDLGHSQEKKQLDWH